ncbi:hypothetical protein SAMN05216273_11923 [Chryseobacterium taihuense]|uniref:Uncharacterized protein n=1 Tax=Chryseobacterium taihuense TaxID=1141221 RepID=A0ABY0R1H0_9FLAO|nr:hypothetical protein SAMN05216273_11923 [Chryseobacterium taihuense]
MNELYIYLGLFYFCLKLINDENILQSTLEHSISEISFFPYIAN